ncbi:MAG: 3-dehydroquinate dehydratase [Acholeplasmatales bacterium]|nr:MAG: 3-dehydroquinate dehydratase [Acholeplasmatales bacterium]
MRIFVINGPNLNLLGRREVAIYGHKTYADLEAYIRVEAKALGLSADVRQSNHEGVLLDWLHETFRIKVAGVLINPGALTHYSYALRDAIKALDVPVYEVHLSDIKQREETFRHHSVIADVCADSFSGHGFESYKAALVALSEALQKSE